MSLSRFEFDLPSLDEQAEIVRRVEKLFAYAERLEARYLSASERVERFTPSLLAKAFRGELVGQDPNDESASALVGRIRETRDAQKAGPSERKPNSQEAIQAIVIQNHRHISARVLTRAGFIHKHGQKFIAHCESNS